MVQNHKTLALFLLKNHCASSVDLDAKTEKTLRLTFFVVNKAYTFVNGKINGVICTYVDDKKVLRTAAAEPEL